VFSNDRAWRSAIDVERTVGWEDFVLMDAIENSSPVSKNADLHCNGMAFVRKKGDIDLRDDCGGAAWNLAVHSWTDAVADKKC